MDRRQHDESEGAQYPVRLLHVLTHSLTHSLTRRHPKCRHCSPHSACLITLNSPPNLIILTRRYQRILNPESFAVTATPGRARSPPWPCSYRLSTLSHFRLYIISLILLLVLTHSLTHSLTTHSLTHSLTYSLTHSLTYLLTHYLTDFIREKLSFNGIGQICLDYYQSRLAFLAASFFVFRKVEFDIERYAAYKHALKYVNSWSGMCRQLIE